MNTKLKCLLLDDELPGLSYLKLLCEQNGQLEVVKAFNDPSQFLKDLPLLEFDLCILDIEMQGISGIAIAEMLKDKPVIFTTAYKEYAANAFDLDAIDYILKPIQPDRLQQAVKKALQRVSPDKKIPENLRLNTDKGVALIAIRQLVYIHTSEVDSRDKTAYLADGTMFQLKNITFEKLISLLPTNLFCRVNKKEMIAMNSVRYFSNEIINTTIIIHSEKPLTVHLGETYRSGFLQKIGR